MTLPLLLTITLLAVQLTVVFGFLLLERRTPAATLAWILAVLLLPGVGVGLYAVFGRTRASRAGAESLRAAERVAAGIARLGIAAAPERAEPRPGRTSALLALARAVATTPATRGNRCRVLVNGAATYRAMRAAIEHARHHVHVEFYIIQPDRTGRGLRNALIERARAGVEVRVLVDAVGSMALPGGFWAGLLEAGGEVGTFGPVGPWHRLRQRDRIDFRDHRKIVVVDGRVGLTGGINVGREYLGLSPDMGHWRDTHVQIQGPAVLGLQRAFAESWLLTTDRRLEDASYYPDPTATPDPTAPPDLTVVDDASSAAPGGDELVQIIDSGPNRRWPPMHLVHIQAISAALDRIWITSPYFVPDEVTAHALIAAALRGVDVRLLLPKHSDHRLVGLASRATYPRLLDAGVRVFEYAKGFIHAKTLVIDDWVGTVGSANMDIRSFQLNYELNAFVFGAAFTHELASHFREDLRDADEVRAEDLRELSYGARVARNAARLLSPLL